MNSTYSVCYYPEIANTNKYKLKLTCFDKRIHVKLKDYNKPRKLIGFENKLNYLISYLLHYQYLSKTKNLSKNEDLLLKFSKTPDILEILKVIQQYAIEHDILGISIKYVNKENKYGNLYHPYFPLDFDENYNYDKRYTYDLEYFLNKLNISIYDYLFNDKYIIILGKNIKNTANNKFMKKQIKHQKRLNDIDLDTVNLW